MGGFLNVHVYGEPGVFEEGPRTLASVYVHSEFIMILRCQSPEAATGGGENW